jgi:glycosyltransferase involved in cell wall biosynthesis
MIFVAHSARDAHGAAGFNTSNSKVIVNGFIIPASASVRRSGRAKIEFVSASRYSAQKNITWMIECFAHVTETFPNIRLHLYGEGLDGDNSVLSGIVDELDLSETIVLHGYAETKDSIYLSKDFYLQTSSMEGFSNSLCEAMSYGVIPICSDVGDNALIVGREGYCFPRGDREQFIASLVEAIEGFLRDPKSHEKKAQRARSSIRTRFAMNRNVQAWSEELD